MLDRARRLCESAGVKGIGELGIVGTAAAANAIHPQLVNGYVICRSP
jgi:hypothetical protein